METQINLDKLGFPGSSERDIEKEIDFFLRSIYLMNENENSNEFENLGEISDKVKHREYKRIKLSETVDSDKKKGRINFGKICRLITHLCNEGKYDFIYCTFESIYMHTWKANMVNINRNEFLEIIGSRKSTYDLNSKELDIFVLELIFDSEFHKEMIESGKMSNYMNSLAKFWCHHKRSTELISNVYLYFDSMFKRFGPGIFQSKNNYRGFVDSANFCLKNIILGESNICHSSFKDKLELEKHEFSNLPLCLIGGLVSIMINMNVIRDRYFNCELNKNFGDEMSFFVLKKIFEMFIQLGISNFGVSKIYLNVMGRYYYEKIRKNNKITEFEDYIKFLKMAVELEKSFLVTQTNFKRYNYEKNNVNDYNKDTITEDNYSEINTDNSLLSFIKNDYWTEDFPLSKKRILEVSCVDWNSYMENTELMLLDILISDDIISRFSKTKNGESKSYLTELIINDDYSSLKFIYNTFKKKKREDKVLDEIKKCVIELGVELSRKLIKDYKHSDCDLYTSIIKEMLDLYLKIERICKESFNDNDKIRNICINDSWTFITNYNDETSKEIMLGLSLFVYNLLSVDGNEYSDLNESVITEISRINIDLLYWLNKTEQNNSMLEFINRDCNHKINKYLKSAMFVFKCCNKKENFQNFYQYLFSQKLIRSYIPNKIGVGLITKNNFNLYRKMLISKEKGDEIIEMLNIGINIFEMYFMFLLYNECGYSFINKFNVIIRDWYLSSSIFKLYILCDLFNKNTDINTIFNEREDLEIKFSSYSKRLSKLSNRSSHIYDKINFWLKLEDLSPSETDNNSKVNDNYNNNETEKIIELKKNKIISNMNVNIPFSIIVLSSNNWSFLNKSDNFIDSELFTNYKDSNSDVSLIYNEITLYQRYYKNIYSRNLIWSFNLGICIMEYLPVNYDSLIDEIGGVKKLDIRMVLTLQQAVLLLCLNTNDNIHLSSSHYGKLRDNISRLFNKNKITILDNNSGITLNKAIVSPILNIKEDDIYVLDEKNRKKDDDGEIYFSININNEFLNKGSIISVYNEISNLEYDKDTALLVIDYVNYHYSDDNSNIHTKQIALNGYLDSFISPSDGLIRNKEGGDYLFGPGDSELDGIKNHICNTFKNNKYKVEAMIIRYLKFKKRCSFLNIIELVTKELFYTKANLFKIDDQEQNNKKSIIECETSKCLEALIQRDLIEVDSNTTSNSIYQKIYCYVP
ncbi:cullin domain containing protein [Cryptosporidium ryanae]|uniref:cullin domain containing protein n=1 Tax=Cryptosporidium ryanae TaxID=515981 RepID=UPI00351A8678|nr:cullin domain containing protein [Cryptosporidium ryanae]